MRRCTIVVSGLVHGVGFRSFASKIARELGLKGFVQNLPNGKVSVVAEGYEAYINKLIDALKKGPPLSAVENVETKWSDPKNEFGDFEIKI
ncbi:MAG: acylphosphatase [Candidatus Aenigmarchaeota archaeon]|nr:acylphosphatase [Candidatus Aenigmarchaeota archaeon]